MSLLAQLEELHKQQELSVMEMFNNVNTTVDKIERGSKFLYNQSTTYSFTGLAVEYNMCIDYNLYTS